MRAFAKRNLKLYFRDKSAVFFSLLAVIISIGLYVLFLGDVYTKEISGNDGMTGYAREIMDNWVMAGTIAAAGITVSLGVLGTVIEDRARKITKDFYVSPMKRSAMTAGYIICAYVVSVFMTMFTFLLSQMYMKLDGGSFLAAERIPKLLGVLLITDFAATGMMAFFVSLFQSSLQAYSSASTVVGTLVGFIMGIYLPIGMYPSFVQWIIKCFPISHGAVLLRKIMMEEVMGLYRSSARDCGRNLEAAGISFWRHLLFWGYRDKRGRERAGLIGYGNGIYGIGKHKFIKKAEIKEKKPLKFLYNLNLNGFLLDGCGERA